jgi:ribosome-binding factor A
MDNVKNQRMSRKATSDKVSKSSYSAHWTKFLSQIVKDKPCSDDLSVTDVSMTEDLTDTTISFSITE